MPVSQVKPEALAALPTSRPAPEGLRAATAAAQQKASRVVEVSSGQSHSVGLVDCQCACACGMQPVAAPVPWPGSQCLPCRRPAPSAGRQAGGGPAPAAAAEQECRGGGLLGEPGSLQHSSMQTLLCIRGAGGSMPCTCCRLCAQGPAHLPHPAPWWTAPRSLLPHSPAAPRLPPSRPWAP